MRTSSKLLLASRIQVPAIAAFMHVFGGAKCNPRVSLTSRLAQHELRGALRASRLSFASGEIDSGLHSKTQTYASQSVILGLMYLLLRSRLRL